MASAPVSASLPRSERSTTAQPSVIARWAAVLVSVSVTIRSHRRTARADQPPLDLPLQLLDHHHRRHAGLERAAHHRALGRAVEPLEQGEQAVDVQPAGGRERVLGVRRGRRVGHAR